MKLYLIITHCQKIKILNNLKNNNLLKSNLFTKLKDAENRNDKKVIDIILHLFDEIEKLILFKEIHKNRELLKVYSNDVLNVEKEGSFHLIEFILLKEIELLEFGDIEAIEVLEKIKKKAQEKLQQLQIIAIKMQQQELVKSIAPAPFYAINHIEKQQQQYKPFTQFEGFHMEKTLGGQYIQVLDPDIKNLVTTDILNSKPQELSQMIIQEIRDIRRNNFAEENSTGNGKSILKEPNPQKSQKKGEWVNNIEEQEKLAKQNNEKSKVSVNFLPPS
jgi:hypothetical protein